MEKFIEFTPLSERGKGCAHIGDNFVDITVSGINGGMKAWLIGGESEIIGNLVGGKIRKSINTLNHNGILITQSGRQIFVGQYSPAPSSEEILSEPEILPGGFSWQKMLEGRYCALNRDLRFILSNKHIYANFQKHGHYWVGENERGSAICLPVEKDEENPLSFLPVKKLLKNGYAIVCVDKKTKKLYIPE